MSIMAIATKKRSHAAVVMIKILLALSFFSQLSAASRNSELGQQRSKRQSFVTDEGCEVESKACPVPGVNGQTRDCFTHEQKCDGRADCSEATDELACSCKQRIAKQYRCDGNVDCPDDEDEQNCNDCGVKTCIPTNDLKDRICLRPSQFCDQVKDCKDGSDEACFRLIEDPLYTRGARGWRSAGVLQQRDETEIWKVVCQHRLLTLNINSTVASLCDDIVGERHGEDHHDTIQVASSQCSSGEAYTIRCAPATCQNKLDEIGLDLQAFRETWGKHSRIIGGVKAKAGSWPMIVSLRKDGEHDCGGTVLNSELVMVAAHCMRNHRNHHYEVRAGMHRRSTFASTVQTAQLKDLFLHPDFNSSLLINDIAIIRLRTPLMLNKWVRPTCLPDGTKKWKAGHECAIAGWGFVKNRIGTVDQLQHALVPLSFRQKCQTLYGTAHIPNTDQVLCAGLPQGGRDACSGDSGGPLVCRACDNNEDNCENNWTQDGIVSFGKGCGEENIPGVYTNVQHYLPWIEDLMNTGGSKFSNVRHVVAKVHADATCRVPWNASLPLDKVCDGTVDCLDGEDELRFPVCPERHRTNTTLHVPSNSYHPAGPEASNLDNTEEMPTITGDGCDENSFRCTTSSVPECVNYTLRCDGTNHCEDGSDELNCTCVPRLYAASPLLVCDQTPDCPHGVDEDCYLCSKNRTECEEAKQCAPHKRICNKEKDCICFGLAVNGGQMVLNVDGTPQRQQKGILAFRDDKTGQYNPVCTRSMTDGEVNFICNLFGYEDAVKFNYVDAPGTISYGTRINSRSASDAHSHFHDYDGLEHETTATKIIQNSFDWFEQKYDNAKESSKFMAPNIRTVDAAVNIISHARTKRQAETDTGDRCSQVLVTCGEQRCGTVPQVLRSNHPYTGPGSQPWAIGLYINGTYICGGTLLHPYWVLTSTRCIQKHRRNSEQLHAVGGSYRGPIGHLRIKGPYERETEVHHIRPITEAVTLLYLNCSMPDISAINPICLPEKEASWPGPWKECYVVGYDGDLLTRNLSLTPAINCPQDRICFQDYDVDTKICPNHWSGLVTCLNSTKALAQWVAVGLWNYNSDTECSYPTTHNLLNNTMINYIRIGMATPESLHNPACRGLQCAFGRCVPHERVCDGRPDCADSADETFSCPLPALRCKRPHDYINCSCPGGKRTCWNGTCIPEELFCDGTADCEAAEDELQCPCSVLLTRQPERLCDGEVNCDDETDELNCGCARDLFRCYRSSENATTLCLPWNILCDGVEQCDEGEDEIACKVLLPLPTGYDPDQTVDVTRLFVDQDVLGAPKPQSHGLLIVRQSGNWYPYGHDAWGHRHSLRFCADLGYKAAETTVRILGPSVRNNNGSSRSVYGITDRAGGSVKIVHITCT